MSTATAVAPDVGRRSPMGVLRATGTSGVVSVAVIVVATCVAVVGMFVTPADPNTTDLSLAWVGPIGGHPLGFDAQGRDVFSRLLAGGWSSMLGPLAVVVVCMTAGTLLAVVAAWRRGVVDSTISSGLDILFAFPGILLAVLAATVFGPSLVSASAALAIALTPYVARVLRGAALKERSQQYVAALEIQGLSAPAICLRHLIPNMMPLIVAQATTLFGYAMVDLAAISYLGLGIQPPDPNWGLMISENQYGILQGYPLAAFCSGGCVVAVVVAFNVLGERLLQLADRRSR